MVRTHSGCLLGLSRRQRVEMGSRNEERGSFALSCRLHWQWFMYYRLRLLSTPFLYVHVFHKHVLSSWVTTHYWAHALKTESTTTYMLLALHTEQLSHNQPALCYVYSWLLSPYDSRSFSGLGAMANNHMYLSSGMQPQRLWLFLLPSLSRFPVFLEYLVSSFFFRHYVLKWCGY